MLGTVWRITKCFTTSRIFTHVWFFSSVGSQMCLEILQPWISLVAPFKLKHISHALKFLKPSKTFGVKKFREQLQFWDKVTFISVLFITNGNIWNLLIVIASLCHMWLTVHLWGFSPVWRRICTTSMYWALNGFSSLEQSSQRQTNDFLFAWIWSLLMCCGEIKQTNSVSLCFWTVSVGYY